MGVPILSINTGSLIEIIENNNNGYFAEDFTDNHANNFVKDLLNDDDYFNNVMNQCIQKSEKYNWEVTADSLLKTYQDVKLSWKNEQLFVRIHLYKSTSFQRVPASSYLYNSVLIPKLSASSTKSKL